MMKNDLNSIFAWYPLVKDVVPTPRTVLIPQVGNFDHNEALAYGRPSKDPEMRRIVDEACKAAKSLGGYPIFIKSDQLANKHSWVESCFIDSDAQMEKGIKNILEFTLMLMFGPDFGGLAVREFLELDWKFHAFEGMPVAREFRFFVKNGSVQCRHPYWFPSCLRNIDCEDWMPKLREMQRLNPEEKALLDDYALKISKAVEPLNAPDNYWSLDFCIDKKGKWWFTDMATGLESFHYTSCEFCPEDMRANYGDMEDLSEVYTKQQLEEKFKKYKNS
jgi:hypothetical protein